MGRQPTSEHQRQLGSALGAVIRAAREQRSAEDLAVAAGIGIDTLRKIERGAISNPGFFMIAAIAAELGASLDTLAARSIAADRQEGEADATP